PNTAQQSVKFYYTALAGNNSGNEAGDYIYHASSADLSVLPIKLDNFNAIQKQKSIQLSWTGESEMNISPYIIERSRDGVNFSKIGEVSVQHSSAVNQYDFVDASPSMGKNFYRIQITEANGSVKYSKTINKVFQKSTKDLIISPNPVRFSVQLNDFNNNTFSIFNLGGQKLLSGTIRSGQINVSTLNPGSYLLSVTDENGYSYNIKFLKQ
ncbi:MAG: T9SS type A sorting domain-containing protein, partial [Ferruginibacter sp.]|nr:T9SS type A sorting domain-containing protein [Ferruginibacter sp.]